MSRAQMGVSESNCSVNCLLNEFGLHGLKQDVCSTFSSLLNFLIELRHTNKYHATDY